MTLRLDINSTDTNNKLIFNFYLRFNLSESSNFYSVIKC